MTAVLAACGSDPNVDPSDSGGGSPNNPSAPSGGGGGTTANRPPSAQFTTNPAAGPNGRIQANGPLTVTFNMCGTTDPDPGDKLRYEFWFKSDGTGKPDAIGTCRMANTYPGGHGVCVSATDCVSDGQPGADHRVCRTYTVCPN